MKMFAQSRYALAAALVALTGALPAAADDIVVRGDALTREEAAAKARNYVQAIGIASPVRPAARWIDPICPRVTGIADPSVGKRVERRIRNIAAQAGARLAKANCTGNLIVAFTVDGNDLARRVNAADPRQLGQVPPEWRDNLTKGSEPVRWWYASEVRNSDGRPATTATLPWYSVELDGGSNAFASNVDVGNESGGGFNLGNRASPISTNAKRAITSATVVIDVIRADGKDLDAITDYAALVGLAEIRFVPSPLPDTILALFQPENPVVTLTVQDLALLQSLYRLPLDRQGRYHRGWLVKDIGKALSGAD